MRHVSVEVPFNSEDEFNAIKMRVNEIPKFGSFAVCLMPTAAFEGKVWLSFEIILNPDGASNAFHGVTAFREGYQSDFEKLVDFASSFVT